MGPGHSVLVTIDEPFVDRADAGRLRRIAEGVLRAEGAPVAELGLLITDDGKMRELNREYAGEDEPTDVLSFSLREGEEFASPDGVERLGEVIISLETAERRARESGGSTDDEVAHLLVHGMLHLLGYDHGEPKDEKRMRKREAELLGPGSDADTCNSP